MLYRLVLAHFRQYTTVTIVAQSYPERVYTVPTNHCPYYSKCLSGQYTVAGVTTTRRSYGSAWGYIIWSGSFSKPSEVSCELSVSTTEAKTEAMSDLPHDGTWCINPVSDEQQTIYKPEEANCKTSNSNMADLTLEPPTWPDVSLKISSIIPLKDQLDKFGLDEHSLIAEYLDEQGENVKVEVFTYFCSYCNDTIVDTNSLLSHQYMTHPEKVFKCTVCGPAVVLSKSKPSSDRFLCDKHTMQPSWETSETSEYLTDSSTPEMSSPSMRVSIPSDDFTSLEISLDGDLPYLFDNLFPLDKTMPEEDDRIVDSFPSFNIPFVDMPKDTSDLVDVFIPTIASTTVVASIPTNTSINTVASTPTNTSTQVTASIPADITPLTVSIPADITPATASIPADITPVT
ncbi:unnamed protein product, partial [Timema podura]|nr:unnamed protein product [Timema podura]